MSTKYSNFYNHYKNLTAEDRLKPLVKMFKMTLSWRKVHSLLKYHKILKNKLRLMGFVVD